MVNRTTPLVAGENYHTFNRGNNKQKIFVRDTDYLRFFHLLYICNTTQPFNFRDLQKSNESIFDVQLQDTLVKIYAVCLMPNHFHLLLTPVNDNAAALFMQKLGTAYSKYFNTKYNRTGALFEGRYKYIHADDDVYLKYLFSYIHLNPLSLKTEAKQSAMNFLIQYPYSSFHIYQKSTNPKYDLGLEKIISIGLFEMYFNNPSAIMTELQEWIQYRTETRQP